MSNICIYKVYNRNWRFGIYEIVCGNRQIRRNTRRRIKRNRKIKKKTYWIQNQVSALTFFMFSWFISINFKPPNNGRSSFLEVTTQNNKKILDPNSTLKTIVHKLDLTTLYGTEMYILNQSQRNRLGGYEPVQLILNEFLLCSGSTLAMKSRSINGTTVSFTIKGKSRGGVCWKL